MISEVTPYVICETQRPSIMSGRIVAGPLRCDDGRRDDGRHAVAAGEHGTGRGHREQLEPGATKRRLYQLHAGA